MLVPGVFWNSWMGKHGLQAEELEVGQAYDVNLDLSRYQYLPRSAPAGLTFTAEIKKQRELGRKKLTLVVRTILSGQALEFRPGVREDFAVEVDVEKLAPPTDDQLNEDSLIWKAYLDRRITLDQISELFRAAQISVPLVAKRKGCSQVAFSIWNETGRVPLDHVVYSVSVAEPDACGIGSHATVTAGFSTLLESLPNPNFPATPTDAAIHIFELPGRHATDKALAILVDGAPTAKNEPVSVYRWGLRESLSKYMSDPAKFLVRILEARRIKDYSRAARELQSKLFTSPYPNEGEIALAAFQRIVRDTKNSPRILARITSLERNPVYVPLSILSVKDGPLSGRQITVIHQSPIAPSVAQPPCVRPWTFAVPTNLGKHQGPVILEPDSTWIENRRHRTVANLQSYLDAQEPPETPSRDGEGLLLLAHQGNGYIWYDEEEGDRLGISDLKRTFAPGSVAVLSACAVAKPDGDNDAWLNTLNSLGIHTIFASPFPVDLEYGVQLSRAFIRSVRVAQEGQRSPTVASLFAQASDEAAKNLTNKNISPDIRHEFVLIGDHDVQLCK
jgi:hypothetical protein